MQCFAARLWEHTCHQLLFTKLNSYTEIGLWGGGQVERNMTSLEVDGLIPETFETWFVEVFPQNIPASKNDPIFVIGDNLSSHFSTYLIQECIKNNIIFVTMPPNSTHLCQPLDVAAFGSLKRSWRKILDHWRKESRSKRFIPNRNFPPHWNDLLIPFHHQV